MDNSVFFNIETLKFSVLSWGGFNFFLLLSKKKKCFPYETDMFYQKKKKRENSIFTFRNGMETFHTVVERKRLHNQALTEEQNCQ